jgi:hypothetical protein
MLGLSAKHTKLIVIVGIAFAVLKFRAQIFALLNTAAGYASRIPVIGKIAA